MSESRTAALDLTECVRFGQEMRTRRTSLGLSQPNAALRCGVGAARWRQLERGFEQRTNPADPDRPVQIPARPTILTVKRIAAGLNWPLAAALAMSGFPADSEPIVDHTGPNALLAELQSLSPQQRKTMSLLIRTMKNPHADADLMAEAS